MRQIARLLVVVAGLGLALTLPRGVAAHAEFERADPPANSILEKSPTQVRAWFTEEPEPRFVELQVYDSARRRVDKGPVLYQPGEPRALAVDVEDLPPGTYTVVWKVLSSVDGHITRGAFPFTVGLDQVPAAMVVPEGADAGTVFSPWDPITRWLNHLVAAILVGAFLFLPLVLGPALRASARGAGEETALATAWGAGRHWGLRVAAAAAAVGLFAAVLRLVVQAALAADVAPWQAFGAPLAALLSGRYGPLFIARMLLLLALLALALYLQRPGVPTRHPGWLVAGGLGAVLLLNTSLGSHAAAAPQGAAIAVVLDWLHLLATALWIGGLVQLVLALPPALGALPSPLRGRLFAATIPRFSMWALGAVGLLAATGLYQTWLQVGSTAALAETPYGQTLLVKLVLLLPLLALGGINLLILTPRVRHAVARGTRQTLERLDGLEHRFRLVVAAEVLLGVLILGTVGLLTSLQPARDALRSQGITRSLAVEDVRAVLRVAPGEAGLNNFDVALSESGRSIADAQRVTLRLTHTQMDMGVTEQRLEPTGDGHYRAQSGALSMGGNWDIEVIVRLRGRDDLRGTTSMTVGEVGAARAADGAAGGIGSPPLRLIVGSVLLALGVLFLADAVRPARRRRVVTVALGCVAASVGLLLAAIAALTPPDTAASVRNPVPATASSIARGQELYLQSCVACHGVQGRGDGPLAATLNPRPANLRQHVVDHPEGQLWLWITDGMPGTAMPAFRGTLSDEDRWHLVNFLRDRFGPTASAGADDRARPPAEAVGARSP